MSRCLYSYLLKIICCSILSLVFIPTVICFMLFILVEHEFNMACLNIISVCIIIWFFLKISILILNKFSKSRITFCKDQLTYKSRIIHKNDISMKYFKFHISLIDPDLVIPKLYIKLYEYNTSIVLYLSKKDVKKLKTLYFDIIEV